MPTHSDLTIPAQSPSNDPRRKFLVRLTLILSSALGALAAVPVLGTVLSPLRRRREENTSDASNEHWIPVAQMHELEVDVPKRIEILSKTRDAWAANDATVVGAVWLLRRQDNQVDAFSTVCPHLGCAVNFERGNFQCPCHTSAFRLDGTVMSGPSPRGMDKVPSQVREHRVLVRYVRYKQGLPQAQEI